MKDGSGIGLIQVVQLHRQNLYDSLPAMRLSAAPGPDFLVVYVGSPDLSGACPLWHHLGYAPYDQERKYRLTGVNFNA